MKKETWKTLIQILVSILTAIGTTLGVTSCMNAVGPRRRRKREAPGGDASLFCRQVQKQACTCFLCRDNYRSWCKHSCQL